MLNNDHKFSVIHDVIAQLQKRVQELEHRLDGITVQNRGMACGVCGSSGVMGYVCPRPDCPSAVRCVSNLQDFWK